jgi:GMP synthase-like glutamine amidotransferase
MPGNALRGLTHHIVGGQRTLDAMLRHEGARPTGLDKADLIIFMGGADISSTLYGEPPHHRAQPPNLERDRMEIALYKATPKQFRIGICRGAQLLHVLNGGKLWQHVEGHGQIHPIQYHLETGLIRAYQVSSTHHQMMRLPADAGQVWAWGNQTTSRELPNGGSFLVGTDHWTDPEIIAYPKTATLCFQPHPEHFQPRDTRTLFYRCINRLIEL